PLADVSAEGLAAVAAALADAAVNRSIAQVNPGISSGWRNISSQLNHKIYHIEDRIYDIGYRLSRKGLEVDGYQDISLISANTNLVVIEYQGIRHQFRVSHYADIRQVDSSLGSVALTRAPRFIDPATMVAQGSLVAPMPGTVIRLGASEGDRVELGQTVLWLEAMKMEHAIAAPAAGIITQLNVAVGQQVEVGNVLAVVEDPDEHPTTEESK
ncbi:MAG: acetyl-CoA carboxylase biotin carboxyl carrier protein subunit, partial [Mycobacteriaceae bacterium]